MTMQGRLNAKVVAWYAKFAIPEGDLHKYKVTGTRTARLQVNENFQTLSANVSSPIYELKDAIEQLGDLA